MEVDPFSVPLSTPLDTAAGRIDRREGFLVTVERDGYTGVGEATPLPGWTEPLDACERVLRAVADGDRETFDPAAAPAAAHAISLARADLRARERGVALADSLVADPARSVPVNATLGDAGTDATVRAANRAVEAGFECLKVKVGARSVEADLDRIRAVREAVGNTEIRVDANGAWDRPAARTAIEGLVHCSVACVEQPLPPDDLAGHAELRGRGVEIALDESVRERGVDAILAAGGADVLVLKPMALGGIGRARDLAVRGRERGVASIVTTTIDAVVARTAALHLAAALDVDRACGLATADRLATDLAPDPAPVVDGRMSVPVDDGIGVRFED